jgi:hypothetical protein
MKLVITILFLTLLSGCAEQTTENAIQAYTLWAKEPPPKEVQLIHGRYWQSSHWTNEYVMYLELKASKSWRNEYIIQNNLFEANDLVEIPDDAPVWFRPDKKYRTFKPKVYQQGSASYIDTVSGKVFIYEVQL